MAGDKEGPKCIPPTKNASNVCPTKKKTLLVTGEVVWLLDPCEYISRGRSSGKVRNNFLARSVMFLLPVWVDFPPETLVDQGRLQDLGQVVPQNLLQVLAIEKSGL